MLLSAVFVLYLSLGAFAQTNIVAGPECDSCSQWCDSKDACLVPPVQSMIWFPGEEAADSGWKSNNVQNGGGRCPKLRMHQLEYLMDNSTLRKTFGSVVSSHTRYYLALLYTGEGILNFQGKDYVVSSSVCDYIYTDLTLNSGRSWSLNIDVKVTKADTAIVLHAVEIFVYPSYLDTTAGYRCDDGIPDEGRCHCSLVELPSSTIVTDCGNLNFCNNNGFCNQGTCQCYCPFAGPDCSLLKTSAPRRPILADDAISLNDVSQFAEYEIYFGRNDLVSGRFNGLRYTEVTVIRQPMFGRVTPNPKLESVTYQVTVSGGLFGRDFFSIRVCDRRSLCAESTVVVNGRSLNPNSRDVNSPNADWDARSIPTKPSRKPQERQSATDLVSDFSVSDLGAAYTNSLSKAQYQSDLHILDIAADYAQDPDLQNFLVPRYTISESHLGVPVAVTDVNNGVRTKLAQSSILANPQPQRQIATEYPTASTGNYARLELKVVEDWMALHTDDGQNFTISV